MNLKYSPCSLSYAQQLWDQWELQSLVLASFALQAFLLFAADLRRRNKSTALRILLWLAYLSADYVAVFVLGHLTLQVNDPHHQLVLLWAPILLLHLGGQETITAFSMEDNELWKRHLLGLVTQVVLAVYVVAKSWRHGNGWLLAPVVLMFVSGTIKYAERTWALRMATPATIKDTRMTDLHDTMMKYQDPARSQSAATRYEQDIVGRRGWWLEEEYANLILAAGDSFPNCINALMDIPVAPWLLPKIWDMIEQILERPRPQGAHSKDWFPLRAFKMGDIQLSLMYDHLYTKVGLRYAQARAQPSCSVVLSLGALPILTLVTTSSALVLFATVVRKDDGIYSAPDVIVSYILLAGAVALELLSVLTLTLSFRSYCFLRAKLGASRFTQAIFNLIRLVRPYHRPLWSNKWAQYNLLSRCIREKQAGIFRKMMRYIGLEGDTKQHRIPDETKELICNELDDPRRLQQFSHVRGDRILQLNGHGQDSDLCKSINRVDFSTSVVMWHVVTDVCFLLSNGGGGSRRHVLLARGISNYLMDLVLERQVLISSEGHVAHRKVRDEIKAILAQHKERVDADDAEAIKRVLEAGMRRISDPTEGGGAPEGVDVIFARNSYETMRPVLPRAWRLAHMLLQAHGNVESGAASGGGGGGLWELIASVWMEMLFHLATRCEAGFHAKNLSTGGEFITHVRFLLHNRGFGWNFILGRA